MCGTKHHGYQAHVFNRVASNMHLTEQIGMLRWECQQQVALHTDPKQIEKWNRVLEILLWAEQSSVGAETRTTPISAST